MQAKPITAQPRTSDRPNLLVAHNPATSLSRICGSPISLYRECGAGVVAGTAHARCLQVYWVPRYPGDRSWQRQRCILYVNFLPSSRNPSCRQRPSCTPPYERYRSPLASCSSSRDVQHARERRRSTMDYPEVGSMLATWDALPRPQSRLKNQGKDIAESRSTNSYSLRVLQAA